MQHSTIFSFFLFFLLVCSENLRSEVDADFNAYLEYCKKAATDDKTFSSFKSNPTYMTQTENLNFQAGKKHLDIILRDYPELIPYLDRCRSNDAIGTPNVYDYGPHGSFSPTTLRYIKIAGDIQKYYKNVASAHIVEVGTGYGGQGKILHDICGFASYTRVDHSEPNELSKKYLKAHKIDNVNFVNIDSPQDLSGYDIIIGNITFPVSDQEKTQEVAFRLINQTPSGYLTLQPPVAKKTVKKSRPLTQCSQNTVVSTQSSSKQTASTKDFESIVAKLLQQGWVGSVEADTIISSDCSYVVTWGKDQSVMEAPLTLPLVRPEGGSAITHGLTPTRLGDNLLSYFHAKWLAYKYQLPFYYDAFAYSDQFTLEHNAQPVNPSAFKNHVVAWKESDIDPTADSTLFIVPYFPESKVEYDEVGLHFLPYFKVVWDNVTFKNDLIASLQPKVSVTPGTMTPNTINLGVHIRRGGGLDPLSAVHQLPLKFPPDSYYIEQIKKVASVFDGQPITVHILTDDLNPGDIANRYQQKIHNPNLTFKYRESGNGPSSNVLDDFCTIPLFDCVIIPQSNFSVVSSKMKDYFIRIEAVNHKKINGQETITEVSWTFNGTNLQGFSHEFRIQ